MTNSFRNRFFQETLIFKRNVNLFFSRAFFVTITNLAAPTYKTYRTKKKEYSITCKMDLYWISTNSSR